MKKILISTIGVLVVLAVLYIAMKPTVNAPTITPTPTASMTPSPTPQASPQANITVSLPLAGATVSSPIKVVGTGRVFEQQLNWRLVDDKGAKVLEGQAMTNAPDVGVFGPYSFTITTTAKGNMEIWVFDYSAKDGSIIDLVKVPVVIK